jgi:hypothetical protein
MSTQTALETGVYVYGVIDPREGLYTTLSGIEGGEIEAIVTDGVAAVVTQVAHTTMRPERAKLAAHHKLLQELATRQTVLPCAFGLVAGSEQQVRDVLRDNRDRLIEQLNALRGHMEMSLSVSWNASNIFDFFVATSDELRAMRDRIFRPGREPSLEERLDLGKRFEMLLTECRERHTRQVIDALQPYCTQMRTVDAGAEQMILKLMCLVPKDQQTRFEEGVQEAARKFDDRYCFRYSGPWAPFDFVDVRLALF